MFLIYSDVRDDSTFSLISHLLRGIVLILSLRWNSGWMFGCTTTSWGNSINRLSRLIILQFVDLFMYPWQIDLHSTVHKQNTSSLVGLGSVSWTGGDEQC